MWQSRRLFNNNHHKSKAEDEVRVKLNNEQIEVCIRGIHLYVETKHEKGCKGIDEKGQQFESNFFLNTVGFVAWIWGEDRDDKTEEEDNVLTKWIGKYRKHPPMASPQVPKISSMLVFVIYNLTQD